MLKASSLGNAIFVCLIISIFAGCLVLMSHYHNLLNQRINFREKLVNVNNASFKYYLKNLSDLQYNQTFDADIFEEDITTLIHKTKWGFYDILKCKTIFKQDTITKTALVGQQSNSKFTALYVTDYDKKLKLSGETQIMGKIKVPKGDLDEIFINGKLGNNTKIKAKKLNSDNKLPSVKTSLQVAINDFEVLPLSYYNSGFIINDFDSETKVIDVSEINYLSNIFIKGNIILYSTGAITVSNTTILNDVVLITKSVILEKGFSGNLQIIAKNEVKVKENVQLKYPSSIYIKNDLQPVKVTIDSLSTIAGGIVIDGTTYNNSKQRQLIVEPSSKVYGTVYCYGKTQLQGEIIGQLYTDRFFLKTQSSEYENVILNGIINGDSLPKNFVRPIIFNTDYNNTYEVIKEF